MTQTTRIVEKLRDIVGSQYVANDDAILEIYSRDMTVEKPARPDVLVMPKTVEEIQQIVRLANTHRVPVVPFAARQNMGGLAIPREGGIALDLKRMDRIIDINEDCMYTILEPGVSFGKLQGYLNKHHPNLRISLPGAPMITSVVANHLVGHGWMALKGGAAGNMINGLEAVLPTGEVVRTSASSALSRYWFGRPPMPDFDCLFVNWQGATGIVTKASIQLWPKPPIWDVVAIGWWDIDDMIPVTKRLARMEAVDSMLGGSYECLTAESDLNMVRPPDAFELILFMDVSGWSTKHFESRVELVEKVVEEESESGRKVGFIPEYSRTDLGREYSTDGIVKRGPSVVWVDAGTRKMKPGGGASWIGSYVDVGQFPLAYERDKEILQKHGFFPYLSIRAMGSMGRYWALRPIIPYDRSDSEEIEEVRKTIRELVEAKTELGAIMYKPTDWAAKIILEHSHPGYVALLKRIKNLLDPNDIMNPGRLNL